MGKSLETSREELQMKLEEFLGSNNVYFNPLETIRMKYPAIVYDLYRLNQRFADNKPYRSLPCYSITIIDRQSDLDWVGNMLDEFEYCSLDRSYYSDNLVHYSFVLYYL